jgi:hypothetical protein
MNFVNKVHMPYRRVFFLSWLRHMPRDIHRFCEFMTLLDYMFYL